MVRNYRNEYDSYHSKPAQRKRRSSRNKARRRVLKGSSSTREVHHKDRNPMNNSRSNLKLVSPRKNRGWRKGK
tara:strand:+ start:1221 stop:1439 length:219 start_codon:yes stop_codon:yes gene_type:complete